MAREGLHGSNLAQNMPRVFVAEFLGTYFLVLAGITADVDMKLYGSSLGTAAGVVIVALAFGATLVALVAAFGHISGCHLNPAVTLGLAAVGDFPKKYVPHFLAAQLLGAVSAPYSVSVFNGPMAKSKALLGLPHPARGVSTWNTFLIEMVVTFFLVLVIVSVATDSRVPNSAAPYAIGIALAVAIAIAGTKTGGAVNPARALGPMIVTGKYGSFLAYIFGPIAGGCLATLVYEFLKPAKKPS